MALNDDGSASATITAENTLTDNLLGGRMGGAT